MKTTIRQIKRNLWSWTIRDSRKIISGGYCRTKRLFSKNSAGLLEMAAKAKRTGKSVNGFTETELRGFAEEYRRASL